MRCIGFSTGALAFSDFRRALRMLTDKDVCAIELSALRQEELAPLVAQLDDLDLRKFKYIAFHAPSALEHAFEPLAIELLERVALHRWPIVVHPNAIHTPEEWVRFGNLLCIENMDKRKPMGQTAEHLAKIFELFPEACLCFDIGHARQVDPTMSEAIAILHRFSDRLKQLHVSEVNTQSKHDALSLESVIAFQRVSHLIPCDTPAILESRVTEEFIGEEIENALNALSPERVLAIAGD
jgi:hypothetical protein